jgi:hypothetical protein
MRLVLVQRLIQRIPRPGMGSVYDDATLFEFLILETFQAGLSWTILNKGRISGKRLTISTIKNSPLFRRQDPSLLLDGNHS